MIVYGMKHDSLWDEECGANPININIREDKTRTFQLET